MTELEFNNILENDIAIVERRLIDLLPECRDGQDEVVEAMKYSLLNGGKRLRPVFCLEFAKACGADRYMALELACAVEYVHTYSLIHDDCHVWIMMICAEANRAAISNSVRQQLFWRATHC